jgi:WD40 repeat protein
MALTPDFGPEKGVNMDTSNRTCLLPSYPVLHWIILFSLPLAALLSCRTQDGESAEERPKPTQAETPVQESLLQIPGFNRTKVQALPVDAVLPGVSGAMGLYNKGKDKENDVVAMVLVFGPESPFDARREAERCMLRFASGGGPCTPSLMESRPLIVAEKTEHGYVWVVKPSFEWEEESGTPGFRLYVWAGKSRKLVLILGCTWAGVSDLVKAFLTAHPSSLDGKPPTLPEKPEPDPGKEDAPLECSELKGHKGPVHTVAFSSDGQFIATGGADETVILWDVVTGRKAKKLVGHEDQVNTVAFSPDGKVLATGGEDNKTILWDVSEGKKLEVFEGHERSVESVAFSPDGRVLATGSSDNSVILWDVRTGERRGILTSLDGLVLSIDISPGGRYLACGEMDGAAVLWDLGTGKRVGSIGEHETDVSSVCFSPDGGALATSGGDYPVVIWNIETGEKKRSLAGHRGEVNSITFSPGGRLLASAGSDATIILWDAFTGEKRNTIKGHRGPVHAVAFAPKSRFLVSAGEDGTVRKWVLPNEFKSLGRPVINEPDLGADPEGRGSLEWFAKTLKSGDEDARELAVEALGRMNDPRAVSLLIEALSDKSVSIRCDAARELVKFADDRAIKPLINALLRDESSFVSGFAQKGLEKIGKPAVGPLIKALEWPDGNDRRLVIESLGKIGDGRAVKPLIGVLKTDASRFLRSDAAKALGIIGSRMAVDTLINALGDPGMIVRRSAAEALGHIGDEKAIAPLREAWKVEKDDIARTGIAFALVRTAKDEAVFEFLIESLKGEGDVLHYSANALAILGDKKAVGPLVESLKGREGYLTSVISSALEQLTGINLGENYLRWKHWYERKRKPKHEEGK